jgi:zinc transporter ZupT
VVGQLAHGSKSNLLRFKMDFSELLLFGLALAGANLVGGLLLLYGGGKWSERSLNYLIALGAGFMLATIFIEILPEAIHIWSNAGHSPGELTGPMALLLTGYLLIHLFEHTIAPHFHFGTETHPESVLTPMAAYTAIGGLSIHTFFDGVSIAAAFIVNYKLGLIYFLAIILHKFPEGFTAASIILASGRSAKKAAIATSAIGLATLAGVISMALIKESIDGVVSYALPFSAGVALYVAASDLIPEVNHRYEKTPTVSFAVFLGVALFYLLQQLIHHPTH